MQFQLKTRQVCLFFIAFLPIIKLFSLPSVIADVAREDMWISTLINVLLDLFTLIVLIFTCKKCKTDFYGLLELNFGKVGSKIILGIYFITFMVKGFIPVMEQKSFIELALYETLPNFFNFMPFFVVCFYLCLKKLRVLGRIADVFFVCTALGLILLFALSLPNCDFTAILPVGARGSVNHLKGSYYSFNWFGDAMYLMFFIGQFEYKKKDGLKIVLSFVIPSLAVILFMIMFYGIFTSIAYRQFFALTEISKYTVIINNIGRFDYFAILFLLASNCFALSLPLYFATTILNKICAFNKRWISALIVTLTYVAVLLIFEQFSATITSTISYYFNTLFFITANVFPVCTALLNKGVKNENLAV
ncbi:MAG: hypothetical protein E7369_01960 [Clostridiales bacterium]|nr:hypothetical protein [Clostridiales bacterium]